MTTMSGWYEWSNSNSIQGSLAFCLLDWNQGTKFQSVVVMDGEDDVPFEGQQLQPNVGLETGESSVLTG